MSDGNTTDSTPANVVLIGFMGTGKTSIGKIVACTLGFKFVDTDALIVKRAKKAINRIFAEDGEDAFREQETAVLRGLVGKGELVISTGGGIVLRAENRELLKQIGYTVWLAATPTTIFERVSGNHDRPLLKTKNPKETITSMMSDRKALYGCACDLMIDTDELSLDEVGYGIVESARVRFGVV
jgi:shikimate kinase